MPDEVTSPVAGVAAPAPAAEANPTVTDTATLTTEAGVVGIESLPVANDDAPVDAAAEADPEAVPAPESESMVDTIEDAAEAVIHPAHAVLTRMETAVANFFHGVVQFGEDEFKAMIAEIRSLL